MPQPRQRKRTPSWSARTVLTYSLLQLPGLVLLVLVLVCLQDWNVLPSRLFWIIIAAWVAKEAILFPFVWRSYDPDLQASSDTIIGQVGVARQRLAPRGYIRVCGVLWRAEVEGGSPPIEPGKTVKVEARQGLTLIVVPEPDATSP
jgi:membrane protein implicated in regulation of membrane protease activity